MELAKEEAHSLRSEILPSFNSVFIKSIENQTHQIKRKRKNLRFIFLDRTNYELNRSLWPKSIIREINLTEISKGYINFISKSIEAHLSSLYLEDLPGEHSKLSDVITYWNSIYHLRPFLKEEVEFLDYSASLTPESGLSATVLGSRVLSNGLDVKAFLEKLTFLSLIELHKKELFDRVQFRSCDSIEESLVTEGFSSIHRAKYTICGFVGARNLLYDTKILDRIKFNKPDKDIVEKALSNMGFRNLQFEIRFFYHSGSLTKKSLFMDGLPSTFPGFYREFSSQFYNLHANSAPFMDMPLVNVVTALESRKMEIIDPISFSGITINRHTKLTISFLILLLQIYFSAHFNNFTSNYKEHKFAPWIGIYTNSLTAKLLMYSSSCILPPFSILLCFSHAFKFNLYSSKLLSGYSLLVLLSIVLSLVFAKSYSDFIRDFDENQLLRE